MLFQLLMQAFGIELHITLKRVDRSRHTSADEQPRPEHPDIAAIKDFITEMDNGHHGGNNRSKRNGR